jgi:MFS family permease
MTTTTELAAGARRWGDGKAIGLVSAAHFVSHFYIMVLAPLLPLVRADFGVSYTELGAALAAFNIISAVLQPPAGVLVDRVSARAVLIGGLLLGATALALAGLSPFFWGFVAMFALLGLANTVYHPADYALLSHCVSPPRMGRAYSVHTFAGMLGTAVAPAILLALAAAFGWRGAFLAASVLGYAVAAVILLHGDVLARGQDETVKVPSSAPAPSSVSLMTSRPVLVHLVFFVLLAVVSSGIQNFSVVALAALRATPLALGNVALTAFLVLAAIGVLVGGVVASRTTRHGAVAVCGLLVNAAAVAAVALIDVGAAALIALMALGGLANGIIMPSRDMLVRAVTPAGLYGTVFGFVTTGFNIGGSFAPLLFGWLIDHGSPQAVFLGTALCCLACLPLVLLSSVRR